MLCAERNQLDKKIEGLLDRIVTTDSTTIISAYEKRVEKMEREKLILDEKLSQHGSKPDTFEQMFEHATQFLSSPWKPWESGNVFLQRTVLKLAFADRITYARNTGLRTPQNHLAVQGVSGVFEPK